MAAPIEHRIQDEVVINRHFIAENNIDEVGEWMWSVYSIRMLLDGPADPTWKTVRYESMIQVMAALEEAEDKRLLGAPVATLANPNQ